jgi:hypothetical protein
MDFRPIQGLGLKVRVGANREHRRDAYDTLGSATVRGR